jgi:hypothetical protein
MLRLTIVCVVAASLTGLFINHALARGRSFPIEVTGTIMSFDRSNQTFTMQVDEPSKIITVGLRWDCKFKRDGAPIRPGILRKNAYVKVSYFATIFTGNLAVEIEANPKAELVDGVIERIEPANRQLTLRLNRSRSFVVRWAANARFINRGTTITLAQLKQGTAVKVSYYSPAFEKNYAVKVEAQTPF